MKTGRSYSSQSDDMTC